MLTEVTRHWWQRAKNNLILAVAVLALAGSIATLVITLTPDPTVPHNPFGYYQPVGTILNENHTVKAGDVVELLRERCVNKDIQVQIQAMLEPVDSGTPIQLPAQQAVIRHAGCNIEPLGILLPAMTPPNTYTLHTYEFAQDAGALFFVELHTEQFTVVAR